MGNKFNFNSQVATSRSQSERLLALGLKKETADVTIHHEYGITTIFGIDYSKYVDLHKEQGYTEDFFKNVFPAWSLSRLINIIQEDCPRLDIIKNVVWIKSVRFNANNIYDNLISAYEWLIKEGYFNKEYLCEK